MANSGSAESNGKPVLALYDFRGKQEFIYRTNRIREITGGSQLLARINGMFLRRSPDIDDDWTEAASDDYGAECLDVGKSGKVIFDGGGNLCVLYRTKEAYLEANRTFSKLVLEEAYSLSLVAACVECTGDFGADFKRVRKALARNKNAGDDGRPCNALPFTMVDGVTFQPIVDRRPVGKDVKELSQESLHKLVAYEGYEAEDDWAAWGKSLDGLTEDKGRDSLIAVIYLDGNSMTGRLDKVRTVGKMRTLSRDIQERFVDKPMEAVRKRLEELDVERRRAAADAGEEEPKPLSCRFIVGNGDENTIICNAHIVPSVLEAYFNAIEEGNRGKGGDDAFHACAGVAICHSHDPYSMVYRIAEGCCKNAKKANREAEDDGNYVDFHYCRAGITGTLEQIRDRHEAELVLRPYRIDGEGLWGTFLSAGDALMRSKLSRGDIKDVGNEIGMGQSSYEMRLERLRAKDKAAIEAVEGMLERRQSPDRQNRDEALRKLLFDISAFYDVWFAKGGSR